MDNLGDVVPPSHTQFADFASLDGEVANPVLATLVFVLARPCHGIRSWNPLFNPLRAHSVETNRRMITQPPSRRGMSDKWDGRFLELAKHISQWSKDPSTKVGCVVIGEDREIRSTGFNGFPRGIADDSERLEDREQKYPLICHAEENAIMHAARIGVSLKGCVAYVTWPPCTGCSRSLIQAGITEVVYPEDIDVPERWEKDFAMSVAMMEEAGITVRSA